MYLVTFGISVAEAEASLSPGLAEGVWITTVPGSPDEAGGIVYVVVTEAGPSIYRVTFGTSLGDSANAVDVVVSSGAAEGV
jgi:hypothetical protein